MGVFTKSVRSDGMEMAGELMLELKRALVYTHTHTYAEAD